MKYWRYKVLQAFSLKSSFLCNSKNESVEYGRGHGQAGQAMA